MKINHPKVVADTIAYLEMSVEFKTADWDGLVKYVHFSLGDEHYAYELVDDKITQDMHLDLPKGEYEVYIHGSEYVDGAVKQRITTEPVILLVARTGTLDGEPFPELSGSVGEQVVAKANQALETVQDLEERANNGEFKGDTGPQGEKGEKGEDGVDGKDGRDGADGKDGKDGEGTFIATYGQTTYADMIAAWKAGKAVILKGDVESALTIRMLVHVSSDKIFFGRVLAESKLVEEVIVTSGNKWSLIKNNYLTKEDLPASPDLSNYATKEWIQAEGFSYTKTKVFQTSSAGVIRCEPNKSYNLYCTDDTQATIRGYGSQNADKEVSGKYLTVYCGGQYDTFTDGNGNTISGNGAALWYATAMTQGTLTPIGSMNVRRGVVKHPDGDHWAEISYPSGCSIIITETAIPDEKPNASGVSF